MEDSLITLEQNIESEGEKENIVENEIKKIKFWIAMIGFNFKDMFKVIWTLF